VAPGLSLEIQFFRDILPALALVYCEYRLDFHIQIDDCEYLQVSAAIAAQ
jgi:hypothetical protein